MSSNNTQGIDQEWVWVKEYSKFTLQD